MNCLEARRALLGEPRPRTIEAEYHLGVCSACSAVATGVLKLDERLAEAASVPAPDGLAARILLARERRRRPPRYFAAAAALLITAVLGLIAGTELADTANSVDVVGPGHPAVAAISEVEQDAPRAVLSDEEATRELSEVLGRLGLAVKKGEATAHYVGKCRVTDTACDVIVLSAGNSQANVILVPDYPLNQRVLVSDGRMSAFASPARSGGYIVVSDTPRNARRMARLLTKG